MFLSQTICFYILCRQDPGKDVHTHYPWKELIAKVICLLSTEWGKKTIEDTFSHKIALSAVRLSFLSLSFPHSLIEIVDKLISCLDCSSWIQEQLLILFWSWIDRRREGRRQAFVKLLAHFLGSGTAEVVWKSLDLGRWWSGETGFLPASSLTFSSIAHYDTCKSLSISLCPKHPPKWECNWVEEFQHRKPEAIVYAHEKNKLSDLPRSRPFSILISLRKWWQSSGKISRKISL